MLDNITDSEIISSFLSVIKNRFNAGQLFARDPPGERKEVNKWIWLVLANLKSHVFFQLCDQSSLGMTASE